MTNMIYLEPGNEPRNVEVRKGIDHLQELVGGLFTMPYVPGLGEHGIDVFANDEGLILQMDPNLLIENENFYEPMVLVGPLLFASSDDEGETVSLNAKQEGIVRAFVAANRATAERWRKAFR